MAVRGVGGGAEGRCANVRCAIPGSGSVCTFLLGGPLQFLLVAFVELASRLSLLPDTPPGSTPRPATAVTHPCITLSTPLMVLSPVQVGHIPNTSSWWYHTASTSQLQVPRALVAHLPRRRQTLIIQRGAPACTTAPASVTTGRCRSRRQAAGSTQTVPLGPRRRDGVPKLPCQPLPLDRRRARGRVPTPVGRPRNTAGACPTGRGGRRAGRGGTNGAGGAAGARGHRGGEKGGTTGVAAAVAGGAGGNLVGTKAVLND